MSPHAVSPNHASFPNSCSTSTDPVKILLYIQIQTILALDWKVILNNFFVTCKGLSRMEYFNALVKKLQQMLKKFFFKGGGGEKKKNPYPSE